jgi:hypothetical protein
MVLCRPRMRMGSGWKSATHLDTGRPGFIRAALAPVCSTTDLQAELPRLVAALRPVRRGEPWRPVIVEEERSFGTGNNGGKRKFELWMIFQCFDMAPSWAPSSRPWATADGIVGWRWRLFVGLHRIHRANGESRVQPWSEPKEEEIVMILRLYGAPPQDSAHTRTNRRSPQGSPTRQRRWR